MGLFGSSGIFSGGTLGTLVGGGLGFAIGGPLGAGIGASLLGRAGDNYDNNKAIDAYNSNQWALMNYQNAYNTPASQMQRYREAGLNPNLVYSQGNPGNMTSTPNMRAHQYNAAQFLDLMQMYYTTKNIQEQNNHIRAQTDATNAATRERILDAELKDATLQFYRTHGYFPNASIFTQVLGEIRNSPFVRYSAEAAGEAVGDAVGRYERSYIRPDLSPQALGREKARAMVEAGFVYDRDTNSWEKW